MEAKGPAGVITPYPTNVAPGPFQTAPELERAATEWFGRQAVLVSSGRTALALGLRARGLRRHADSVHVPPYLARCVINAITFSALPTYAANAPAMRLAYHQFGFPVDCLGEFGIIEDCAHAWHGTNGGRRPWIGEMALASVTKFFPLDGMVGLFLCDRRDLADAVRAMRDAAVDHPATQAEMRGVFNVAWRSNETPAPTSLTLDAAYELLYAYAAPDPVTIATVPGPDHWVADGAHRRLLVRRAIRALPSGSAARHFLESHEQVAPWAIPILVRGGSTGAEALRVRLSELGVMAPAYHVATSPSEGGSSYQPAVLMPAHLEVDPDALESWVGVAVQESFVA